jgi:serine/threonine-protein kinase
VAGDGQGDRPSWASTTATADSWLRDAVEAPARTPASLEEIAPHLAVGDLIAERFRLEQQLGEGGMGVVWAARHVVTRKSVALKFVKHTNRADPETRQRFLREARAACAVRHPSVVEVHDVLELDDGSPVMVMDLLVGESMAQRLHREHKLPLPEVARIMVPVCAGVGSAHALGIVHRDLKPDNIFLCVEGDGSTGVKVLDFGIAKLTATEGDAAHTGASTNTGMLLGTPYYMAPEQMFAEKDIDHRADLWAIGVILYQALAGQRPTQGANVAQIIKVIARENIVPLRELAPSLPEPVLGLVGRLLALDRDERASDLREVVSVLSEYTSVHAEPFGAPRAAPSSSAPTPVAAQAPTRPARRWSLPAVIAGLVIGGAGVTAIGILRPSSAVTPAQVASGASVMVSPTTSPSTAAAGAPSASTNAVGSAGVAPPATAAASPAQPAMPVRPSAPRGHSNPMTGSSAPPNPAPAQPAAPSPTPAPRPSAVMPKMSDDL